MNSLERIGAALRLEPADRVPVVAQVFGHAATLAGVPLEDYLRDGEVLARCQASAWEQYGYDAVFSVMDVNVEAEALGSSLRYRRNEYPVIQRPLLTRDGEWKALSVPEPQRDGRMPEMLKALTLLRRRLGGEALVVGCVLGPFTLATQLLGLEAALYLAIDDPARLCELMDFATEVVIRFGQAQLQVGAHLPVVFDPSASPAVVPPGFFREFELPRLQRVFQALSEAGATANWLHIAGPAGPILPYYPKAGAQLACFDYSVSFAEARKRLPRTCLTGNLKSLMFVEGSPAEVETEAMKLLKEDGGQGGLILSSGCEVPPESRPENIAAMVRAAKAAC